MSEQGPRHPAPADPWRDRLLRGHETGDVSVRRLGWFVLGFVLTAAAIHAGLWALLKVLAADGRPVDAPASAVAPPPGPPAAAPPLQPRPDHDRTPRMDLAAMDGDADATFARLGWAVDLKTHRATPPPAVVRAVAERRPPATSRSADQSSPSPSQTRPTVTPIPGVDEGGAR